MDPLLYEALGHCRDILPGMEHSGHLIDSDITRLSNYLEKKGIVTKQPIKDGQGAYPVFNWLKKDLFAFLNILIFLSSFSKPFDNDLFLLFGNYIINSSYGKEVINKDQIVNMLDVILGGYTENDKQNILKMAKISPSALLNLLELFKRFNGNHDEQNGPIKYNNQEIKKLILDVLLTDMIISVGKDLKNHVFIPSIPFKYSTTIDFNIEKTEEENKYRKCKVEKSKVTLQIKDLYLQISVILENI